MTQPKEPSFDSIIHRIDLIEKDVAFLREHGLSTEEQEMVLEKDKSTKQKSFKGFYILLFLCFVLSCFNFIYMIYTDYSRNRLEKSDKMKEIQPIEDFSLP